MSRGRGYVLPGGAGVLREHGVLLRRGPGAHADSRHEPDAGTDDYPPGDVQRREEHAVLRELIDDK